MLGLGAIHTLGGVSLLVMQHVGINTANERPEAEAQWLHPAGILYRRGTSRRKADLQCRALHGGLKCLPLLFGQVVELIQSMLSLSFLRHLVLSPLL